MFKLISRNVLQEQKNALNSAQERLAWFQNDRQDLLTKQANMHEQITALGDQLIDLRKENDTLAEKLSLANKEHEKAQDKLTRISNVFEILTKILKEEGK